MCDAFIRQVGGISEIHQPPVVPGTGHEHLVEPKVTAALGTSPAAASTL